MPSAPDLDPISYETRYDVFVRTVSGEQAELIHILAGKLGLQDIEITPATSKELVTSSAPLALPPGALAKDPQTVQLGSAEADFTAAPEADSVEPDTITLYDFRCYWGAGASRVFHIFTKLVKEHPDMPLTVIEGDEPADNVLQGSISETLAWLAEHQSGGKSSAHNILERIANNEPRHRPELTKKEIKQRDIAERRRWHMPPSRYSS